MFNTGAGSAGGDSYADNNDNDYHDDDAEDADDDDGVKDDDDDNDTSVSMAEITFWVMYSMTCKSSKFISTPIY